MLVAAVDVVVSVVVVFFPILVLMLLLSFVAEVVVVFAVFAGAIVVDKFLPLLSSLMLFSRML